MRSAARIVPALAPLRLLFTPVSKLPSHFSIPMLLLAGLSIGCSEAGTSLPEVSYVRAGALVPNGEYAARRAQLMDRLPDGVAIIPGATSTWWAGCPMTFSARGPGARPRGSRT